MNKIIKRKLQVLNGKFINNIFINNNRKIDIKQDLDKYITLLKDDLNNINFWKSLTIDDTYQLNLRKWDNNSNIYLFPYYLYDAIPIGLEVYDIFGKKSKWKGKEDKDIRFGMLAYGIKIK